MSRFVYSAVVYPKKIGDKNKVTNNLLVQVVVVVVASSTGQIWLEVKTYTGSQKRPKNRDNFHQPSELLEAPTNPMNGIDLPLCIPSLLEFVMISIYFVITNTVKPSIFHSTKIKRRVHIDNNSCLNEN